MQIDTLPLTAEAFAALDADDPLRAFRDEFALPEGVIYLDGNSLGAAPKAALARAQEVVSREWATDLIKSWNTAGWFELPERLGDKLAPVIGAGAGEVLVTDATGLNVFKVLAAALALRPDRKVIVMEGSNFPTDNYMAQGLVEFLGQGHQIRFAEKDDILAAIDQDVAAVCLTHVHYKTGHILDMQGITAAAHQAGALAIWDLCHSAGAMPVDLNGARADFAVGCSYKYLNGGPGGPAFLFVARRHQGEARQPLTGWWGHKAPFAFSRDYAPAPGLARFRTGTQPILSMAVAEVGLDIFARADMALIRQKSLALTSLFIRLVDERCGSFGFGLASPRDADARGSQVALTHATGYPIMKALIAHGVIGDFRAPDILRFGFTPLYTSYMDVWNAAETLYRIMASDEWKKPVYSAVDAVT
ncbi:kynureninase [Gimibacter soli]|uniref:Kynureninase n=1 Tax=Gimibacter soli TaxID=3024400 RepID=A0AAE9XQQ1_9PROT|nr:kynureninase [Gimibacter soli]WCL53346.1 kynureninase [Gimibacter soli]